MRTPGLWASMRGMYALRSFGEAEGDSSCIRGLRLMGLFVRHALRAGTVRAEAARPLSSPLTPEIEELSSFRGHDLSHTGRFAPRARNGECATCIPGSALRATGRRSHIGPPL